MFNVNQLSKISHVILFSCTYQRAFQKISNPLWSFQICQNQTCHSIFIENTEKFRQVFKAMVEGLWRTSKTCWGWGWGPGEPWWRIGGEAPEKFCDLALLGTPWFTYFSITANAKNNAQEDYNGYKKAFGWYKVVIVKVGIQATC